ncbi:MAG: bifunctional demethylmenaquinone methyltransferase/2-methoxy-6-polyprenyl-1,4-benzoquinol methylase UbiE [Prosthecochloris sp.]|nr:bifunctional demethylmenaquinone methyltransferase/2-methoxy-6-polyprenyl-1,4-benzoquinol methylase UbiE [Prosthecochloris sp.]
MAKKAETGVKRSTETARSLFRSKSHASIQHMFDEVAPTYDFLNHLLSLGIDNYWRSTAARKAKEFTAGNPAPAILDVATGTGDLAKAMSAIPGARVSGIDLSSEMLTIAAQKYPDISFREGYAENIEFDDSSFDIVSAGFGARNFEDLLQGLKEFHRVLKPGGHTLIIEPMIPRNPVLKNLYLVYFKNVLPKIASLFSKSSFAYDYLPHSVEEFPQTEEFLTILRDAGFSKASYRPMTFETSILYIGQKEG